MKFYLAGPVGYGHPGIEWKSEIKKILRVAGHEVYDPIENDTKYPEVSSMNLMKKNPQKNWRNIKRIMQKIFIDDCLYIEKCDYIICYFIGRAFGTISEQGIAYYCTKLNNKRVKTISIFEENFNPDEWTLCCSDYVFFSLYEFIHYLKGENNEIIRTSS